MRHTWIAGIALLLLAGPALAEEPAVPSAGQSGDAVESEAAKSVEKEKASDQKNGDAKSAKGAKSEKDDKGDKVLSGMSIVGNDEAPKSLVIVPWKSSELGQTLDISKGLDDGRGPVDKDVFMRELAYYQIRAASSGSEGSGEQSREK